MVEIVLGIIISVIIVVLSTYLVRMFDIVLDIYIQMKKEINVSRLSLVNLKNFILLVLKNINYLIYS